MNDFYVYLYCSKGAPLYVGKGHTRRIKDHIMPYRLKSNTYWSKKLSKLLREGVFVYYGIVQNGLSEEQAFNLEKELILKYGRMDLKTGILYNTTNGGEGSAGHIMSVQGRARISESMSGRHIGNQFAKGMVHTEESKKKISEKLLGRIETQETREKKSQSLSWQIETQISVANIYIGGTWWGPRCEITYSGEVKRQSKSSTHRLYNVTLDGITVKRTITDFKQGSCPREFAHLKAKYL